MNKLILIGLISVSLIGCSLKDQENVTNDFVSLKTEPGLADCNIYKIASVYREQLTVIRCPNSSTTTNYKTNPKYPAQTITVIDENIVPPKPKIVTIDGIDYIQGSVK